MTKSGYLNESLGRLAPAFTQARTGLLEASGGLVVATWARGAKVTGKTSGAPHTVLGYATRMAEHEMKHLAQLRRTLEAVRGPGAGR